MRFDTYMCRLILAGSSNSGWVDSFVKIIGLEDLVDTEYSKLGKLVCIHDLCDSCNILHLPGHFVIYLSLTLLKQLFLKISWKCLLCILLSLGCKVSSGGEPVGNGLTLRAANDLGLWEGMPVGTSLIDAHAGGLGKSGYRSFCINSGWFFFS